jgi:hypothetical protein
MDPSTINWQELTATAAMCGVFVWGIVKGLPTFYSHVANDQIATREQFTTALKETRQVFSDSLSSQRSEFRDDLAATREQSRKLAEAGHTAVNRNTSAVDQLTDKLDQSLTNGTGN